MCSSRSAAGGLSVTNLVNADSSPLQVGTPESLYS
jgi:hypothetical protein